MGGRGAGNPSPLTTSLAKSPPPDFKNKSSVINNTITIWLREDYLNSCACQACDSDSRKN